VEPFLVFRRTGKTIAKVIAFGFGGGTVLLGLTTAGAGAFSLAALAAAARGYFLAALPFFVGGAILAACWRELWVVPGVDDGGAVLRMVTYRPWMLRGPRVEQAAVGDYASVCAARLDHRGEQSSFAVALMTRDGEQVPVREFDDRGAAETFVAELAAATGLPIRRGSDEGPEAQN
jgi:hypothetical protein